VTVTAGPSIPAEPPDAPGAWPLHSPAPALLEAPRSTAWSDLRSRLARCCGSVWLPVVGRAVALGAVFAALGTVGAISVALGLPDTNELPPGFAVAGITAPWLAPGRTGGAERARSSTRGGVPAPLADSSAVTGSDVTPPAPLSAGSEPMPGASASPPPGPSGSASPSPAPSAEAGAAASSGLTPDGKVILNRAGLAELMRLPGVGPKRAEAILALRERLGAFRRPTDLLRVRGIGPASLQKMQPHFVLDPPPPSPPPAP